MVPQVGAYSAGQVSKKVLSGPLGQLDSPSGQVPFHSHLPDGQGIMQVKGKLRLTQDKQNFRATCPKGKVEFNFFASPVTVSLDSVA